MPSRNLLLSDWSLRRTRAPPLYARRVWVENVRRPVPTASNPDAVAVYPGPVSPFGPDTPVSPSGPIGPLPPP
ncbi:unannotated protein [freshwater metagenome]|uniref:Unannotated protein n=1 Tax=freshwater metagenome TaxID=449393 RepID=A0A6J6ZN96_9ZZZZ